MTSRYIFSLFVPDLSCTIITMFRDLFTCMQTLLHLLPIPSLATLHPSSTPI